MKIGIYTPYLDSFGGGERYMLTIAETLSKNHDVDLLLDEHQLSLEPEKLIADLGERLGLDLTKVNLKKAPLQRIGFLKRLFFWKDYDVLFYLTDGSVFYSTAKKSIIHFQVPFENIGAKGLWGKISKAFLRIKLSSWDTTINNSQFTKSIVEKGWPVKGEVVYPPVDVKKIKPLEKKKQILSVGRFVSFSKSKKHEEMIEAFADLHKNGLAAGWSLHLAGSVEGDESYVQELQNMAKDVPVKFYPNCSFDDLLNLYGESSVYWHAAGFSEEDPSKMEHFGITTVEAMAGGCVPVVIAKGGQPEIVEDGSCGFLWNNLGQLQDKTLKIIRDPKMMGEMAKRAIDRSRLFSKERFEAKIKDLI